MFTNISSLEGFLRAMQGNLMALVVSIAVILIIVWIINMVIRRLDGADASTDTQDTQGRVRFFGWIAVLLTFVGFVANAAFFAAANYTPRVDIDKSGVYEQMQRNTQPSSK